jgi:hypothetical protein
LYCLQVVLQLRQQIMVAQPVDKQRMTNALLFVLFLVLPAGGPAAAAADHGGAAATTRQRMTTIVSVVPDCRPSICNSTVMFCIARMQVYLQLRQQIIVAQPVDKQPHLAACLDKLMTDVGSNLEPKNRWAHVPVTNDTVCWCVAFACGRCSTSQPAWTR